MVHDVEHILKVRLCHKHDTILRDSYKPSYILVRTHIYIHTYITLHIPPFLPIDGSITCGRYFSLVTGSRYSRFLPEAFMCWVRS